MSGPLTCVLVGIVTGGVGLVLGIMALSKTSKQPALYTGRGMAIAGVILNGVFLLLSPVLLGIGAAIAIPSLLRARVSANESMAIGDVRTVISAQTAYQMANRGYFDTLECLATPSRCLPGYSATDPTFLDPAFVATDVKSGYRRTLQSVG